MVGVHKIQVALFRYPRQIFVTSSGPGRYGNKINIAECKSLPIFKPKTSLHHYDFHVCLVFFLFFITDFSGFTQISLSFNVKLFILLFLLLFGFSILLSPLLLLLRPTKFIFYPSQITIKYFWQKVTKEASDLLEIIPSKDRPDIQLEADF